MVKEAFRNDFFVVLGYRAGKASEGPVRRHQYIDVRHRGHNHVPQPTLFAITDTPKPLPRSKQLALGLRCER